MKRKIIGFFICMLVIVSVSAVGFSECNLDDLVDIKENMNSCCSLPYENVKNIYSSQVTNAPPLPPGYSFIFGKITNLQTQGSYITFEAVKLRVITFAPFTANIYNYGETCEITDDYIGFLSVRYVFARCQFVILP